jgi:formylglycine-generating enzyme required for sulfatase activity
MKGFPMKRIVMLVTTIGFLTSACSGSNPSKFHGDPKRPVEQVSWNDAVEFCRRLSELPAENTARRRYGLPTEAQWEYACRAGTTTRWYSGDDEAGLADVAWFSANAGGQTHAVGGKRPNAWGLYDMHGNVGEWCHDWYGGYDAKSPLDDPSGPLHGVDRVSHGTGWDAPAWTCRSAVRRHSWQWYKGPTLGFRVSVVPADEAGDGRKAADISPMGKLRVSPQYAPQTALTPSGSESDGRWKLPPGAPDPAVAPFNTTTAKQHQEAWAKHLGVPVEITNSIGTKLVLIPPGEFTMGSPDSDKDAQSWEKPQHRVRITKPFYLGKYPVTQEQWEAVMGSNPSGFKGPKNPVETVSWDDCQKFLGKLNAKPAAGVGKFQLPTEAQWEYACRAGSKTRYCFGDEESKLGDYASYAANSGGKTHPVGEKKPNAWGLYDVHGNVWEWCQDRYDGGYYAKSPMDDPTGPTGGSDRVLRGGGWNIPAGYCRSAFRRRGRPGNRYVSLGLRVSLVPADK